MNNRPYWADDAARDTDDRCLSCQRRPYETHTLDCRPLPSCGALDVSDDPYDVVSGLACQRERGHDGNHRACDPEGRAAVSWPAAPSPLRASRASPSAREEGLREAIRYASEVAEKCALDHGHEDGGPRRRT